jgi:NhaA family Na+:H+ antiporter
MSAPQSACKSFFAQRSRRRHRTNGDGCRSAGYSNSPAATIYFAVLKTYVFGLSIQHWIKDALMAAFFLLVGLEIKRDS